MLRRALASATQDRIRQFPQQRVQVFRREYARPRKTAQEDGDVIEIAQLPPKRRGRPPKKNPETEEHGIDSTLLSSLLTKLDKEQTNARARDEVPRGLVDVSDDGNDEMEVENDEDEERDEDDDDGDEEDDGPLSRYHQIAREEREARAAAEDLFQREEQERVQKQLSSELAFNELSDKRTALRNTTERLESTQLDDIWTLSLEKEVFKDWEFDPSHHRRKPKSTVFKFYPTLSDSEMDTLRTNITLLPHHPHTPSGLAEYENQVKEWERIHGADARVTFDKPFPLAPGGAPILTNECYQCGKPGHSVQDCWQPREKWIDMRERAWRKMCGFWVHGHKWDSRGTSEEN